MVAVLRIEPVKRTAKPGVGLGGQALPSFHPRELRNIVASKLILDWSPDDFGWLKIQYPDDESMRVSHEPFTEAVHSSARSAEKELLGHCDPSAAYAGAALSYL